MSDYWIRAQASQRHADYLRELEHAELVEEAKAAAAARHEASESRQSMTRDPLRHRWQAPGPRRWMRPAHPHFHIG